jgi:hypothetical protein
LAVAAPAITTLANVAQRGNPGGDHKQDGRTAFSRIVRENHDCVTVLIDSRGRAPAQCTWSITVVQLRTILAFLKNTLSPEGE